MKAFAHAAELAGAAILAPIVRLARLLGWRPGRVTIVGWWGSETVGDVAILGQLLDEIAAVAPGVAVRVVSFDAALTREWVASLGRSPTAVVATGLRSAWSVVACRALIVGGGPLMESPSMLPWVWRARLARLAGASVMLYANGIGPVRTPATAAAIAALLRIATQRCLRDDVAVAWARERIDGPPPALTFDPAYEYVRSRPMPHATRGHRVALALRAPPSTYLGAADASVATEGFLTTLATALDRLVSSHDVSLVGIVMHTGHPASDDHEVLAALRRKLRDPARLTVQAGTHRIPDVVRTLRAAGCALTVRFHAMVFALATETPFVAIDYARPTGKVSASAALVGRAADVVTWDEVTAEALYDRLVRAMGASAPSAPDLAWATRARLASLRDALG